MKEMKVSILGFGMMGVIRGLAYRGVSGYYKNTPIQPVLGDAYCLEAEAAGAKGHGWNASSDMQAVIKNPETRYIDVCLPNALHHDAAIAAFEAGKHVFCEKPLSANLAEGKEMAEVADKYPNLLNSCNFIYRRCPANVYARKLAQSGKFGKLLEARMYYHQGWGGPDTPGSWRFERAHGGGAAGDLGSHSLDMLYYVTGQRPIELCAMQTTHIKQRWYPTTAGSDHGLRNSGGKADNAGKELRAVDVDDAMRVMFTLKDGAIGTLSVTRNAQGSENQNGYELFFEKGSIKFCFDELNYLNVYDASTDDAATQGWSKICCNRGMYRYFTFAGGHMDGYRDLTVNGIYENMLAIEALESGSAYESESPIATFRDAYNVQRTLAACDKSIAERCWVKLEDIQ